MAGSMVLTSMLFRLVLLQSSVCGALWRLLTSPERVTCTTFASDMAVLTSLACAALRVLQGATRLVILLCTLRLCCVCDKTAQTAVCASLRQRQPVVV